MDVDEKPSTGSSSSATQEQTAHVATSLSSPQQKQQRDIANGAVQRERRKRDRLKDWQVVKNAEQPVASPEEHESDVDETDGNENNEPTALGFAAPLKAFVVSDVVSSLLKLLSHCSSTASAQTWRTESATTFFAAQPQLSPLPCIPCIYSQQLKRSIRVWADGVASSSSSSI